MQTLCKTSGSNSSHGPRHFFLTFMALQNLIIFKERIPFIFSILSYWVYTFEPRHTSYWFSIGTCKRVQTSCRKDRNRRQKAFLKQLQILFMWLLIFFSLQLFVPTFVSAEISATDRCSKHHRNCVWWHWYRVKEDSSAGGWKWSQVFYF